MASREKHRGSSSTGEEDSDENYSSNEDEGADQRSSNTKPAEGTEYDEEASPTGTSARKGSSGSGGKSSASSEDPEDSEVSEDDETNSSTNSGSSKSTVKDAEEGSEDSDAVDSNGGTGGRSGSLSSVEGEGRGLEDSISTSSRLKTVHSKPTSSPLSIGNVNAATPILPLPSTPPSSAQPVGCAGGVNATSSYCSAPGSANHASKLDSRAFFVTALVFFVRITAARVEV